MKFKSYHHGDLKNALTQAGIEILAEQGLGGLTLRKVAERAGVSHAAPYSHFTDKQSLFAAISTEGFRQLYALLSAAIASCPHQPRRQLDGLACTYAQFAMEKTESFKLMFSSLLEKQKEYPELVQIIQQVTNLVNQTVADCLQAKVLQGESPDLTGVIVWGQVHGIILLALENQIPSSLLDQYNLIQLVQKAIDRACLKVDF